MKALKAYNTEAITRFHQRKVDNTEIVETPQDDPPGPPVPANDLPDLPESDLDIPDDPILDFVNSQCHSSEDLDQALQAYQAYQVPYSHELQRLDVVQCAALVETNHGIVNLIMNECACYAKGTHHPFLWTD